MHHLPRYLAAFAAFGFLLGCSDEPGPAASGSAGDGVGGTGAAGASSRRGCRRRGRGGSGAAGAGSGGTGAGGKRRDRREVRQADRPSMRLARCRTPRSATRSPRRRRAAERAISTTPTGASRASASGARRRFAFPATPINVCGVWQTVEPGGPDSEFCVTKTNDPRWSEGFDDNTSFNYLAARIRQPFDFEGRTGTIQWEADARTSGSHGWWVETWITEDPVPGVNVHDDQLVTSKEAVGIELALNCGKGAAGLGHGRLGQGGREPHPGRARLRRQGRLRPVQRPAGELALREDRAGHAQQVPVQAQREPHRGLGDRRGQQRAHPDRGSGHRLSLSAAATFTSATSTTTPTKRR